MRSNAPPLSIRPSFSFSRRKEKEEKKGFLLFFHVNGLILYRKVFRAIGHIETSYVPIELCVSGPSGVIGRVYRTYLRDRNLLLRSTAVTPEKKRFHTSSRSAAWWQDRYGIGSGRRFPIYGPSERRARQVATLVFYSRSGEATAYKLTLPRLAFGKASTLLACATA
ncbi:hypothetical protein ACFE04_011453 [Oxalis oulophora]